MLHQGDVRLMHFGLNGRIEQIQNLRRPANQAALALKLVCKDFQVSGEGIEHPFHNVYAEVNFENGDLRISVVCWWRR